MTTRAFTDDEVRLLEAALLERRRYRDRLFLILALRSGLRASELLSLDWSRVLSATGEVAREIIVERAHLKGGAGKRRKAIRSRRIPLTEGVRGAVADLLGSLGAVPQGPIFKSRVGEGRAITRMQAHRLLKGLARELGLDAQRIGCHSARKHFAQSIWRRSGFNLLHVQKILGHSSPLVSALYLDSSRVELDALVLGLDQPPAVPSAMSLAAAVGTSA